MAQKNDAKSRYERKLARQRQLEMMEAAASGTVPTMELDTVTFSETDGMNMRQRGTESARRFLNESEPLTSTTPRKTAPGRNNLFAQQQQDPASQVNLMDHVTGVYSTSSGNMFTDAIMSVKKLIYTEHDASAATDGDVYLGEQPTKSARLSTVGAAMRRRRRLLLLVFGIFCMLFASYAIFTTRKTPDEIRFAENEIRFNEVLDQIILEGVSKRELLTDPKYPEHHALRWVSYTDPARLDPLDPMILQRYALAVFYYNSFITFERIAGKQKPIQFEDLPQFEGVPNPGWRRKDYWMSEKGVCTWWGVYCVEKNENGYKNGHYDENREIEVLNLTSNRVYGTIPPDFRGLSSLIMLDLSNNHISGKLPKNVGHLYNLGFVYLNNNELTGTIPTEFGLLESVKDIDIGHNQIRGSIPTEVNRMYHLRALGLENNLLTGDVPLTTHTKLLALFLDNNRFDGTFPFNVTRLTNLYELRLHNNEFHGTIPPEIESLDKLEIFQADHNQLTGSLPEHFFSDMSFIEQIYLSHNKLEGELPAGKGGNGNLKKLYLDHNEFSGGIPDWYNMHRLEELHLYDNKLDGSIHTNFGAMSSLREVWLQNNEQLTGSVPSSIGNCTNLEILYLEHNNLRGDIPTELGRLTGLKTLRLEHNVLHGTLPLEVCNLKQQELSFVSADCPPRYTCPCCDECGKYN